MFAPLARKPEDPKHAPAAAEPKKGAAPGPLASAGSPAGAPRFVLDVQGPAPVQRRAEPDLREEEEESTVPFFLQAKLAVSPPGDPSEREAGQAAVTVTRQSGPARIQRQTEPGAPSGIPASMPEPNASVAPPKAQAPAPPQGKTIPFEGVVLAPDSAYLRYQLEQMAVAKGEGAADAFAWRFINMDWAQKASLGAQHGEELVNEIQIYLREEALRLEYDNKEFLKQLEQKATEITRELLANSRTQIEKELAHYGITSTEVAFGDTPTTVYSMGNQEAGKGLQTAAAELAVKRRTVDEVGRQSMVAREAIDREARANPFLIPPALQEAAESTHKVWQAAEKEYADLANGKQAEFPILAAYATGPGAAGRLEQLSQQSSGSLGQSIGETAQERLKNIAVVESELGGRFNVWKQQRVLDLAMRQMSATPMQSRVASDNVAKVKADAESSKMLFALVAIGLGLLAAIPTGGSSLLAGIAATAAVMGAGLSLYAAYEEAQEYALAAAATGTDFDKAKAISQDEPSMLWLALDIVAAVADVYAAAAAFKALRTALQAARTRGVAGIPELVGAARRARLSPAGQGRLIAEAMDDSAKIEETIRGIRQIYRNLPRPSADERLAEAFQYAAEALFRDGKVVVVPADKAAQRRVLLDFLKAQNDPPNARQIVEYLIFELADDQAYYHAELGIMVLKGNADSSSVATFLAHEIAHRRQDVLHGIENMGAFESEFQAIVAEREFLKLLPPEQIQKVLPEHVEILGASDQRIAEIAAEMYPDMPKPPGFNPESSAKLILKALRGM